MTARRIREGAQGGTRKQARLLRSSDFRRVYNEGSRRSLDFLVAFALRNEKPVSRIGLTVPRAVGAAVQRNLLKRRLRESTRKHLAELGPGWDIVFNVRRSALDVKFAVMDQAVQKFFLFCAREQRKSSAAQPDRATG